MTFEGKLSIPDVWDAGVDWLTMTWKNGDADFTRCKNELENFGQTLNAANFESKFTSWQGYSGWQFGKIFLGERPDGLILRASGNDAKTATAEIRKRNISGKPTRCDVQATAHDREAQNDYGGCVRKEIESFAGTNARAARRRFASYKDFGHDSGFTIGARSGERFARFYNKTFEQRNRVEKGLWRYEMEYKGRQAQHVWNMIKISSNPYWLALSVVKSEFAEYGANMEFIQTGEKYERASSYTPTSVEKSINWLANDVRNTVTKLRDLGYEAAMLEALGLTDLTTSM